MNIKKQDNLISYLMQSKEKKLLFIPLLFAIYFYYGGDYRVYVCLSDLTFCAMIISYVYSIIVRVLLKKGQISSLGFSLINSLILFALKLICISFFIMNVSFSYYMIIYAIQNTLSFLQVGVIFKFRTIIDKLKYLFLIYYLQVLYIICIFDRSCCSISQNITFNICLYGNLILSFCIGLMILKEVISKRKKMDKVLFEIIFKYIVSIVTNYIYLKCSINGFIWAAHIFITIEIYGTIIFYDKIVSLIHKQYTETAMSRTKEVNDIITKRNIILNEINLMIQKSANRYNKLVDFIYDGVFLFHMDKLQYVNKNGLEFLNLKTSENLIGVDLEEFTGSYFNKVISVENNEEVVSKIKNEDENIEIYLIKVDDFHKILYVHDISDLNENKKLREELREYLEIDEIKKKFFANISHELKTPINVIFSALQLDHIHIQDKNINGIKKNSLIIKQNCLRLIRTINNFIDANKISEGYIVPNFKVYNIVEVIEDTANLCDEYIKLVDNELIFDADEEELYVRCDKEMIMTIILNILSNSVKYSIKGGWIKIYVESYDEDNVRIRIKNNGLKIDEKTVPYIFDKFTKLNKAFNRLREGSGLGLFLTKGLVELQGGSIRLKSSEEGNEFIIEMPRVQEQYIEVENFEEELQINQLKERVDIEFSDIYIE